MNLETVLTILEYVLMAQLFVSSIILFIMKDI